MSKEPETFESIIVPKLELLIESASGKYPTLSGFRIDEDIFVCVTRLSNKDGDGRDAGWGLIFVESDLRGSFELKDVNRNEIKFPKSCFAGLNMGKKRAAKKFAQTIKARIQKGGAA